MTFFGIARPTPVPGYAAEPCRRMKGSNVGGAVLTGGSAVGTVGGAAVGGIIGHEVSK
jgi:hypothetical protein